MGKNTSIDWISVVKVGGAWVSFCIGSGFATGQAQLQYFCGYGIMGFVGILVAMLLYGYTSVSFLKAGHEHQFANSMEIFEYYGGKTFGKVLKAFSVVFLIASPIVMIAGFGASLNQFFHAPLWVGAALVGVLAIITVLLGLRKMVDIIGMIGPVIIVITLATGGIYLTQHWSDMSEGIEAAVAMDTLRIGKNWFEAGIIFAAWSPLISAPFLVATATTVKSSRDAVWGGIWGNVFYGLATVMIVAAFFTNYKIIGQQAVPTLYLANSISAILGYAFLAVIFLGIYSSAVPSLFTFCATFFKEGTARYRIFTIVSISLATLISVTVPFGLLMNRVYTFYGYLGMIFTVLIAIKQIRVYQEKRSSKN